MSANDRLSIEQIEHYTKESNYTPPKPIRMLAKQLLEAMRENEYLKGAMEEIMAQQRNKDSND